VVFHRKLNRQGQLFKAGLALNLNQNLTQPQVPVVQSLISTNHGLNFNLLFLFMYFCMISRFKTLENKTSVEPRKISGKTYSTGLMSCWKI
jgi:hypothetical protein